MKNLDKTSIIGIITCIGIMILLFMRMQQKNYEQQQALAQQQAEAQAAAAAASPSPLVVSAPESETPKPQTAAPAVSADVKPVDTLLPAGQAAWEKSGRQTVTLKDRDQVVYTIDPAVGVVSAEILKYRRQPVKDAPEGNVVLGNYDYPFLALGSAKERLTWQALQDENIQVSDEAVSATRVSADGRLSVTQTWSLVKDRDYEIDYKLTFKNLSGADITLEGLMIDVGGLSPMMAGPGEIGYGGVAYMIPPASENHCESLTSGDLESNSQVYACLADPNATAKQRDDALKKLKTAQDLAWVSIHTRYFMQGIRVPANQKRFASFQAHKGDSMPGVEENAHNMRFRARVALAPVTVKANGEETLSYSGLVGPMDLNMLSHKGIGLEGMLGVDRFFFGAAAWMGSLSKLFLNAMVWLSGFIPGKWALGFALILLTVIVKLVLWPLSLKGSRSMKKMQELQPQIKELREKYKSDPQEMMRRQQELFKQNNVSQLGGCLPMLIQIPIFFALFNTFRGTIELRQASFLWAADLSLPDTIFSIPLPVIGELACNPMSLIMVATMIWQQATMPTGDPSQKRMMFIMSIMFAFFLYTQPSGLTLYMTVNQLLSMLQFWMIRRLDESDQGKQTPEAKPAPSRA